MNRLLERNEGFSRIVTGHADGHATLELQPMRKWRSPDALLLPVGEALAQFVCTEDFSTVKACEGPVCTLLLPTTPVATGGAGAAWPCAATGQSRQPTGIG